MKTKLAILLSIALGFCCVNRAAAQDDDEGAAIIADVVIARPACLAATAVGSVFFVVSLPFSLATKRVKQTAQTLVVQPAKATFTRRLGDFDAISSAKGD